MVKQEIVNNLVKTYTDDETKTLKQVETGIVYGPEVYDTNPTNFTYEEVDAPKEKLEKDLAEL